MSERRIPRPEEIQKEFEELIRSKYGGSVQVFATHQGAPPEDIGDVDDLPEENDDFSLDFNYKPRDIKEYLDRFVIQQDDAKKALAIAVCDHYNHARFAKEERKGQNHSKQNVLLLGPTGVGKTYLVKLIAELIGVPFVKADATKFTESGYVGANVDDMIRNLVSQANGNLGLAQYGIVYLDEADKLASPPNLLGRDVSGRGVQIGLLKLMEETDVDLRAGNDVASQMQAFMEFQQKGKVEPQVINTKHILFIVSGAFTGLKDIIQKRLNTNSIGIGTPVQTSEESENVLAESATQDFVEFGFEPEFIGRLPVRVSCQNLEIEDLFQVLKSSEGSLIHQYVDSFKAFGIDVTFSDKGLREIAKKAFGEKTGARALMTVLEKALREYKFELPSTSVKRFVVDEKVIDEPAKSLKRLLKMALPVQRQRVEFDATIQ